MGTIGDNLKKILENRGLSTNAAAKKYGLRQTTLNDLVSGKTVSPQMKTIKPIAEGLGVSVSELMRDDTVEPDGGSRTRENTDAYGTTDRPPSGFVLIPRYNVEASAGGGAVVSDEQVVDRLAFREEWVRHALGVKPQDLALVTTIGDSMEPTLHPGDVVMLDMSVTQIQNNALYALQVNGSLLVKRVQRMMDGRVIIRSDNDLYEPETISTDMADSIKVVGRIVWAGRKF